MNWHIFSWNTYTYVIIQSQIGINHFKYLVKSMMGSTYPLWQKPYINKRLKNNNNETPCIQILALTEQRWVREEIQSTPLLSTQTRESSVTNSNNNDNSNIIWNTVYFASNESATRYGGLWTRTFYLSYVQNML